MKQSTTSGFTLLELMVCLSILAILLSIGIPPFSRFLVKQSISAQTHNIWRLLSKTRELAIYSGKRISLCGLDDSGNCNRTNITSFVIYEDTNRNDNLDNGEPHIEHLQLSANSHIRLSLGLNRRSFSYNSNGSARQSGGIIVCPDLADPTLIQKVTLNNSGRLYLAPDRNGDGRVQDSEGKNIEC